MYSHNWHGLCCVSYQALSFNRVIHDWHARWLWMHIVCIVVQNNRWILCARTRTFLSNLTCTKRKGLQVTVSSKDMGCSTQLRVRNIKTIHLVYAWKPLSHRRYQWTYMWIDVILVGFFFSNLMRFCLLIVKSLSKSYRLVGSRKSKQQPRRTLLYLQEDQEYIELLLTISRVKTTYHFIRTYHFIVDNR